MFDAEESKLFDELNCGPGEAGFDEPDQSESPSGDAIELAKAEAKQYAVETGRPVEVHEEVIEESDGAWRRVFGWRSHGATEKGDSVRSTVELLLAARVEPVREEDGVVRLFWPPAADAPPQDGDRRTHIEPTAYPIRSPETASLILYFLFEQKQKCLTPRELKQTAMILEGQALRHPRPMDIAEASLRSPVLEVLLLFLQQFPNGCNWTATQLLGALEEYCEREQLNYAKSPDWPLNARSFSRELRLVEPWLADAGFELARGRDGKGRQLSFQNPAVQERKLQGGAGTPAQERAGVAQSQTLASADGTVPQTQDASSTGRKLVPPIKAGSKPMEPNSDPVPSQLAGQVTQSDAAIRDFSESAQAATKPDPKSPAQQQRRPPAQQAAWARIAAKKAATAARFAPLQEQRRLRQQAEAAQKIAARKAEKQSTVLP